QLARPDFCGWSALGPISLTIENVLAISCQDAGERGFRWHLHQTCRHGVKNLRFGDVTTSLIYDGQGTVESRSNRAFKLKVGTETRDIPAGSNKFTVY
ncbi:MAG: hypothetical protein K9N51_13295, partial [Candidatus Pacebacteria bacterium]|nr:hypothetical protein [Candidatus Paceibacterota bacterium]